ncbi:hypothetical protein UFOVP403_25 [uncultured Caudovirales phage]|uniref:Tail tubular protein B n=1 Tax=uncultured Caudovirales phage TaxID=2100421 RepID=A0A6J5M5S0_9CAUD|nr:hypothetical protein UFOVP403_25 [uncultured Caudovirales phage]
MALITVPIPNMLNGVSQQTPSLRFATQAEAQENAYSSPVEGLGKRPPTEHVASLIAGNAGSAHVHVIDRGDGIERYILVLRDDDIKVFDTNGVEQVVVKPDGVGYLNVEAGYTAETAFKAVSVGDYTFIVNRGVQVTIDNATTTAQAQEALVWVKQGAYSTKYTVSGDLNGSYTSRNSSLTNGTIGSTQTVDGESFTADTSSASSNFIAASLKIALTGGVTPTITRNGYVIHITQSPAFSLTVSDGLSGSGLGLVKGSVQSFTDLPSVAKNGMVVDVEGLPESGQDNYWLKFTSKNGANIGEGSWSETVAPGIKYRLTYSKMPHVLIRQSDGSFIFKEADGSTPIQPGGWIGPGYPPGADYSVAKWADRECGDEGTNPAPSFVGKTINDIFLFRGRFGILAGENVILSEAAEFFNFWRTTVTTLLDTDPIDIGSAYSSITIFRSAIPFSERLVLFSDQAQFVMTGNPNLTPTTATLNIVSNYDCLNRPRPAVVGESIFFPFDRGGYSGIREMIANPDDSSLLVAPDISAQIPKYIKGKIIQLSASSHDNVMVALADGDQSRLYVYRWLNSGNERVQSSWSEWSFNGGSIKAATWSKSTLFMVIQRNQALYLEKLTVEPNRRDTNSQFITALDRRFSPAPGNISHNAGITTITLPYQVVDASKVRVVRQASVAGGVTTEAGYVYDSTATNGSNIITIEGNLTGIPVWVGDTYTTRYEFSIPYLKGNSDNARVAFAAGRFQLRNMSLIYSNTAFFTAKVTHKLTGTQYTYTYTGNLLGTGFGIIGQTPIVSGTYKFPIYGKNDEMCVELINDTHMPSYFMSAEYESSYDTRSQRG